MLTFYFFNFQPPYQRKNGLNTCKTANLMKIIIIIFVILHRYWMLPGFVLKKMIMDNFISGEVDPDTADAIDFMVERVSSVTFF